MKLSVCVPVYNAEPFVERCARSLFEQTYPDIEYVFVDDGSPDDSVAIVERALSDYPKRATRAKFLRHDRNRGVSAARRTALEAATGDLVVQCDPDDWVDADLYAAMIRQMEATGADAVMCPVSFESPSGSVLRGRSDVFCVSGAEALRDMERYPGISSLVLRIVRRELMDLDAYEFPEGLSHAEDLCLSAQLLPRCRLLTNIAGGPVYHYRQSETSLSHSRKAARIVSDHQRVYDVLSGIIESRWRKEVESGTSRSLESREEKVGGEWIGAAVCRHLARTVLYWGTTHGLLSRDDYRRWRKTYEDLGGAYAFDDCSPWGRRLMTLADRCFALSRFAAPLLQGRVHDSL